MNSSNNNQKSIDTDTLVGELLTRDLRSLSDGSKQVLLDAMFGISLTDKLNLACSLLGCGTENDGQGQVVLYTGMMYADGEERIAVPFEIPEDSGPISDIDPDSDLDVTQVESHELEEEPDSSDENYDAEIPPTIRTPNPADYMSPEAMAETAQTTNNEWHRGVHIHETGKPEA